MYDDTAIIRLDYPDNVRHRPGVYIGDTDITGVLQLFREIVANAVDEFLAGYGNTIDIVVEGNEFSVRDYGRGIPLNSVVDVATGLHVGGKFTDKVYGVSGGLHGVGLSVTNALSERMLVKSVRSGKARVVEFSRGKVLRDDLIDVDEPDGTLVTFAPDPEIFESIDLAEELILRECVFIAAVNEIRVRLRINDNEYDLSDLTLSSLLSAFKDSAHDPVSVPWLDMGTWSFSFSFVLCASPQPSFLFVNSVPVSNSNLWTTLVNALSKALVLSYNISIEPEYLKRYVSFAIAVRIPTDLVRFRGQTKDIATLKVTLPLDVYTELFVELFKVHPLKKVFQDFSKVVRVQIQEEERLARQLKEIKKDRTDLLVGRLAECLAGPDEAELYLVEGESAGGSARQARSRQFQAVLALKGKVLNAVKSPVDVLKNVEIQRIMQAVGMYVDRRKVTIQPRYSKIIIATDADPDGRHITTLLLSFFWLWAKPLVLDGFLYIARTPLYKQVDARGKFKAFYHTEHDVPEKLPPGHSLQYFKGLGELNPEDLHRAIFDPATRHLVQVSTADEGLANAIIYVCMGPDVEIRRDFIMVNLFDEADRYTDYSRLALI